MGSRYIISQLKCAACSAANMDIWYAESSGAVSFRCVGCGKLNLIQQVIDFRTTIITEKELAEHLKTL